MLEYKLLETNSGKSYIKLIKEIREYGLSIGGGAFAAELKTMKIPSGVYCKNKKELLSDSLKLNKSRLKHLFDIPDAMIVHGDIRPELVAEEVLKFYNAKDFEHDLYRALLILTICQYVKGDASMALPSYIR